MKHIGHVDGATNSMPSTWKTHSLGMLAPHDLFIPNPGERENVDADRWRHVGWINPDKDGGAIYTAHANAAEYGDARPAYIASDKPVPVFKSGVPPMEWEQGKTDPMDVRRSEYAAHAGALDSLTNAIRTLTDRIGVLEQIIRPDLVRKGVLSAGAARSTMQAGSGYMLTEPMESTPSVIGSDDLIKEVLEFCAEELDGFMGPDLGDAEIVCSRSAVYIRELVRRLQSQTAPAEPPMTFYDHAFIACASAGMAINGLTKEKAIRAAKELARFITENRPT